VGKWIRRHPAVTTMGAAIAAVIIVAFLLVTEAYHDAVQQKEGADVERAKAIANEKLAEGERQKALKLKGIAEEETRLKSAALVQNHVSDGIRRVSTGDILGATAPFISALAEEKAGPESEHLHRLRLGTVLGNIPRLVQVLVHDGHLSQATITPDGKKLATAGGNSIVQVWDTTTAKGEKLAAGLNEYAMFSNDSRLVLTIGYDQTARVWDLATGRAASPILRNIGKVTHAAVSSNGLLV